MMATQSAWSVGGVGVGDAANASILLVEDDAAIASTVIDALALEGYSTRHAPSVSRVKALLAEALPDLILLDIKLPDGDGRVLCGELKARAELVDIPIIICSGSEDRRDQRLTRQLGADDFIPKPFDLEELLLRIQGALRWAERVRAARKAADEARERALEREERPEGIPSEERTLWRDAAVPDLAVDHTRHRAALHGVDLRLTPMEFRLLLLLAERPDQVIPKRELAQALWGHVDRDILRSLEEHTRRLRGKLEGQSSAGRPAPQLVTVRGVGYCLTCQPVRTAPPDPHPA